MNIYFLAFEITMVALFLVCLSHARRQGLLPVLKLIAGTCFGLILEWATIQQLHAYQYGTFPTMLGEIPVAIGVGWGVIIYSAGLFTDALNVKTWMKPVLDGLIALNIDLSMDIIAIRLGMWDWGILYNEQFLGVKWGNFWAWFWVVFFFSAAFRYFSGRSNTILKHSAPFMAIAIGIAGVMATNFIIAIAVPESIYHVVVIAFLISVLAFTLYQRPRLANTDLPFPAVAVPMAFHAYFLLAGFISGWIVEPIYILFISLSMLAISLHLHRHWIKDKIRGMNL